MFFGLFELMFGLVLALIVATLVRGLSEWNSNNHSPALDVEATVVSRRTQVSHHMQDVGGAMHNHTDTSYYVTFQFNSGDRLELRVPGREYGMMVEGDQGILAFQGTRFLKFVRR